MVEEIDGPFATLAKRKTTVLEMQARKKKRGHASCISPDINFLME